MIFALCDSSESQYVATDDPSDKIDQIDKIDEFVVALPIIFAKMTSEDIGFRLSCMGCNISRCRYCVPYERQLGLQNGCTGAYSSSWAASISSCVATAVSPFFLHFHHAELQKQILSERITQPFSKTLSDCMTKHFPQNSPIEVVAPARFRLRSFWSTASAAPSRHCKWGREQLKLERWERISLLKLYLWRLVWNVVLTQL